MSHNGINLGLILDEIIQPKRRQQELKRILKKEIHMTKINCTRCIHIENKLFKN